MTNMPTRHLISWADHEAAGINITQYKQDFLQRTGIPPTHAQIREFIQSHTRPFFGGNSLKADIPQKPQKEEYRPSQKPHHSTSGSHIFKNPINVYCGYKRELYPAYELLGPNLPEAPNKVYIEWGNGKKELVDEAAVVRGELPMRSRKRTDRYEPVVEKEEKSGKKRVMHDATKNRFRPISKDEAALDDDCSGSGESYNIFESDSDES